MESNWLPAPNGPIYLVMRMYWPRETPPSILPAVDRLRSAAGEVLRESPAFRKLVREIGAGG